MTDNIEQSISIILPCYNERANILALIKEINTLLKDVSYEIVVVDDNSPDGTFQAVVNLNYSFVKAILRTQEPSLAKSIRQGIEASQGDIIIIMDSDFNHPPDYLPIFISNCNFYDVVLGSRFVYGGKMDKRSRHMFSWCFNILVRILTRTFITDSLFGYVAIHRSVLDSIKFDDVFWGFGDYCIRLMYYLQKQDYTILQIPVILGQRKYGTGNARLVKTLFQYLKATLQLVFNSKRMFKYVSRNKAMSDL